MKIIWYLVLVFTFQWANAQTATPTARSCEVGNSLQKEVDALLKPVVSKKYSATQLKKLYQSTEPDGVVLTLLKPEVFDGHVMMVGLAYGCFANLKTLLKQKKMNLSSTQVFYKNWKICASDLYGGKIPKPVDKIEKLLTNQIKICQSSGR